MENADKTDLSYRVSARDTRSDELKAAAILGVVCIHAGLPSADILRFCVPVFITLWAFHYELGMKKHSDHWHYACLRFYRLAIPYFFWTMLYLLLLHPATDWTSTPLHTILGGWFGGYGWAGQYFFIILFQLTWLFPLMRHRVTFVTLCCAVVFGLIMNTLTDYYLFRYNLIRNLGDRLFIYWLPYVFLGIVFARGFPRAPYWLLLGALALLLAPAEIANLVRINGHASPYLVPSVTVGSIALLLTAGPRWRPNQYRLSPMQLPFIEWIRYIGRNSFPIFVCNPLILLLAQWTVSPPDQFVWSCLSKVLMVVVAVVGSLLAAWALRRLGLGLLIRA